MRVLHRLRQSGRRPPRRRAFTLIDLMIVLVILGILAAIAAPLIKRYVEDAERAAAEATLSSTEKAIGAYRAAHGEWPPAITPTLYQNEEPPTLPDGYAFDYNPATGEVALIETH